MKHFAVFGNPISHSLSPKIFNQLFSKLQLEADYHPLLLPLNASPIDAFRKAHLQGANVTIPFKEKAFQDCDEVRGIAKQIGSVNTLVLESNQIIGYNTDAEGFYLTISQHITPQNTLIIGAGGSAKAIAYILRQHQIPTLITNRSPQRLTTFTNQGYATCLNDQLDCNQSFDLIINTTSAGLQNNDLPLPQTHIIQLLHNMQKMQNALVCDIIYGHTTPLLALAYTMGIKAIDGLAMLHMQAALSAIHYLKIIDPSLTIDIDTHLQYFQ